MRADSLALDSPGQLLREVRGFGKAWLGGTVDSATNDRDWMRGDTVVASFTPSDSAGKKRAVLSRIEARAAAQSYHLDRNAKAPAAALDQLRPGRRHHRDHEEPAAGAAAWTGWTSAARSTASSSRPAADSTAARRPTPPPPRESGDEHPRMDRAPSATATPPSRSRSPPSPGPPARATRCRSPISS